MSFGRNKKHAIAASAVFVVAAVFFAYLPSLDASFLSWDDGMYVYANPNIRVIDVDFFKWASTAVVTANWHPLTLFSYALDYVIWGLNPTGYHLTNIIFHSLNSLLVFFLALRLGRYVSAGEDHTGAGLGAIFAALIASLLFGLHPTRVESVTWVSERKDVLCAFFFILSVYFYIGYADNSKTGRWRRYVLSFVFFLLALMSKPMAVTLPAVLFLLDFYPLKRLNDLKGLKPLIVEKIPFFMLTVLSSVVTLWAQGRGGAVVAFESIAVSSRVATAVRAYAFYLYKLFIPVGLAPMYPYPTSLDIFSYEYAVSAFIVLVITALCLWTARRQRQFLVVWLCFVVTLVPVIGLVQVSLQAAADRYTYLPSISIFMLIGFITARFFERQSLRPLIAVVAVLAFAVLTFLTVRYQRQWRDSLTLWNYELEMYPDSELAYFQRGVAYRVFGNYQMAVKDFSASIKKNSRFSMAYYERAMAYSLLGDNKDAIVDFSVVIEISPGFVRAYNDRGVAYGQSGRYDEAMKDFNRALELDPSFEKAYINRGFTRFKRNDYLSAIEDFKKALSINPSNPVAYNFLGDAYSKAGAADKAARSYEKADSLKKR